MDDGDQTMREALRRLLSSSCEDLVFFTCYFTVSFFMIDTGTEGSRGRRTFGSQKIHSTGTLNPARAALKEFARFHYPNPNRLFCVLPLSDKSFMSQSSEANVQ